jgi:hypothetical protein
MKNIVNSQPVIWVCTHCGPSSHLYEDSSHCVDCEVTWEPVQHAVIEGEFRPQVSWGGCHNSLSGFLAGESLGSDLVHLIKEALLRLKESTYSCWPTSINSKETKSEPQDYQYITDITGHCYFYCWSLSLLLINRSQELIKYDNDLGKGDE